MKKLWMACCVAASIFFAHVAFAGVAFVIKLEDNGTIAIADWPRAVKEDRHVRMYGVTLPTLKQPFGKEAQAFLRKHLTRGAKIEISPVDGHRDEDGFESVLVQVNGHSLNYALVDEGLAWVNRHTCKSSYCRRWYIVEHKAVQKQKGIWSLQKETPPWQWSR